MKLCLTPFNGNGVNGTHHVKVVENGKGNKKMAHDPLDSRREDELLTGHCIPIDIYDRKNEMRGKIYNEMLYQRKQKLSTGLSNKVIIRKGMKKKKS